MGPLFDKKRLSNSIQRSASIIKRAHLLSAISKKRVGGRGNQLTPKRGSGGNSTGNSRFLLSDFPCSKKEWKTQADHRFIHSKQICFCPEFQDGNTEESEECHSSKRLGIFVGLDGRLFACPYSSKVTQIPSFHSKRPSVSLQSAPIRSFDQSLHFHSPHDNHCDISKEKSYNSSSLSRRLVVKKSISSNSVGTQTFHYSANHIFGTDHQSRKIRSDSHTNVHLYRNGISNSYEYSQSSTSQNSNSIRNGQEILSENLCISPRIPFSFGTTQCSSRLCNARQITSQTITNVSACSMEATNITASTSNKVDGGCSTPSKLVETTSALPSRCSYEGRSSISSHFLGCQSNRLGFTPGAGRTSVSWSLVQNPIPTPHQYFRNDGHFIDTEEGSSIHKELQGSHINRQHNSSSIFEPSGGDTFTRPLHGSLENSNMVSSEPNKSSDKTHSGEIQCSGRSVKQNNQTDLNRMGSQSIGCERSFSNDPISQFRSVRNSSKSQTSTVCISDSGPKGTFNRRSHNELESHTRLCVSSFPSHSLSDKQNKNSSVQSCVDSPLLAQQNMVSRTTQSVDIITNNSPDKTKPTRTAPRKVFASKSRSSATSRMGIIQQSIRDKKFSKEVADHVSRARRESTRKVYDAKWRVFVDWTNQKQINPIKASPTVITDFLIFLFRDKKCQVSTIKGYRSTISNTLKFKSGYDIGSHPIISELIKSFETQRPVERSLAPKWDLSLVLSHICKAPFEPLHEASLLHLSMKTAFLLTMATARRVSEVHAFAIDKEHFRFSNIDGSLIIRTQVGFLAKNQLPTRAPDSIKIPKLSNFCARNDSFSRLLCPIRAIKVYLKRTKILRKNRNRLFIPTRGDHDINKSTISKWVKYTIKHAYKAISTNQIKLLKIRAHELRALSASWAYFNFIPLDEIIKAAVWSNSSIFASHYLRDFSSQTSNLHDIGPVVVAQKVVGGGQQSGSL